MELRVLKYFIKISEEENMTKAAQKLHVSQPALSKQMKEVIYYLLEINKEWF